MKVIAAALLLLPSAVIAETVNFETATLGSAPQGWTFALTGEGDPPGWEVVRDPESPATGNVLAQVAADRNFRRYSLATYSGPDLSDGRLVVRFKAVSGGAAKAAGLVWRYQDENNYYVVRADALRENVALFRVQNGRRRELVAVEHPRG
jgi:hypothetical protein